MHQDENHARRKGRKKEEEKQLRVVRARAAPDALPRGPHRGFGKNCLSPPYRNKSNTWVKDNPDEKYRQDYFLCIVKEYLKPVIINENFYSLLKFV